MRSYYTTRCRCPHSTASSLFLQPASRSFPCFHPQREQHRLACAALFKFPNASAAWCPRNLTDISLVTAYYNQVHRARVVSLVTNLFALIRCAIHCSCTSMPLSAGAADFASLVPPPMTIRRRGYALPNAIYTDAVSDLGTLLTSASGWAQGGGNKVRRVSPMHIAEDLSKVLSSRWPAA
jgi:hypothetical protein